MARGVGDGVGAGRLRLGALRVDDVAIERVAFHFLGDAVHGRHRFHRIFAGRRFRRQHHRVGALVDGGGDVGDFRARRHRRIDHRFQHLRGDDHRLAGLAAGPRHLLLHGRHFLQRHFHAEIAARHHQRVGKLQDLGKPLDRLRLFDLGHHRGAAARDLLGFRDVLRPLDEGQRHPVDAGGERGFEIGAVLLVQRGKRNGGVGQADALAVGQPPADLDARGDALRLGGGNGEAHLAVVDQQRAAGRHRAEDFRMRQISARRVARRRIAIEHETCRLWRPWPRRRQRCRAAASVPASRSGCRSAGRCLSRCRGSWRPIRACDPGWCGSC